MTRTALCLLMALLLVPVAQARQVGDIAIPDNLSIAGEARPLILNGAGVRKKFMFKVYIGALYTNAPMNRVDQVLTAPTTRVMHLHFLREVSNDKLTQGWTEGFANNHSVEELRALDARLSAFNMLMPGVKAGDVLRLDLLASGQTRVLLNGAQRGAVDGVDFQRALLKLWLGAKPADEDMKATLLGGGS